MSECRSVTTDYAALRQRKQDIFGPNPIFPIVPGPTPEAPKSAPTELWPEGEHAQACAEELQASREALWIASAPVKWRISGVPRGVES
jgi:hypothetical protein